MALEHKRVLVQLSLPGRSFYNCLTSKHKSCFICKLHYWNSNLIFILTLLLCVFMQPLTVDIHYYYILELSFYLSLLFSQFTDIRRKVRMACQHMNHASSNDINHWMIVKKKATVMQKVTLYCDFFNLSPPTFIAGSPNCCLLPNWFMKSFLIISGTNYCPHISYRTLRKRSICEKR